MRTGCPVAKNEIILDAEKRSKDDNSASDSGHLNNEITYFQEPNNKICRPYLKKKKKNEIQCLHIEQDEAFSYVWEKEKVN